MKIPYARVETPSVYSVVSYKMYFGYLVLVPLLLILWIYIILIVKNNLALNTSIEVNIMDRDIKTDLSSMKSEKNVSGKSAGKLIQLKKTVKHHVPKFMLELYEKNKRNPKNNDDADLVRSLIPTQAEKLQENDVLEELSENHLLIFEIPRSAEDEKFIGAELKILTKIDIHSTEEIGVKKSLKISVYNEYLKTYSYLQEIQIHYFNDTWLSFNLTKEVQSILQADLDKKILKVIITVSAFYHQTQNNFKLSLLPVNENFEHDHNYPILLLSYTIEDKINARLKRQHEFIEGRQIKNVRKRRNIEEDYEEETNIIWSTDISKKNLKKYKKNNCRKKPLYVDFSEIKYDLWIVQPTGYDAYQCQGRCFYPVAQHLSPTKHAIMQSLMHSVNPSKASRSCCVPTHLDSISILYVDDKGVLTYRYAYKDMVVLECGCR